MKRIEVENLENVIAGGPGCDFWGGFSAGAGVALAIAGVTTGGIAIAVAGAALALYCS